MPPSERFKYCDHLRNQVLCNDLNSIFRFHMLLIIAHTLNALSFLQLKSEMKVSKKMFEAGRPMLKKALHDLNVAENEGAPPAPVINPIMADARMSMRRHRLLLRR